MKISKAISPISRYSIVRNTVGLRQIQIKTPCLYHLKKHQKLQTSVTPSLKGA